jgi:hypothetical protein
MRTFLVVDRESLDEALAEARPKDKIVIAEGAFEKPPRLVLDGGRWIIADDGMAVHHWDLT